MMVLLSLTLNAMEQVIFLFIPRTDFSDHMASMTAMVILIGLMLALSKKLKIKLTIFPAKFTTCYLCLSIIAGLLLILTPSNFSGTMAPILLLIYSSIVTPIFEELFFRGYIWNKMHQVFSKEWKTYVMTTVLFALWHLGYVNSIAFRVEEGLLSAMIWKVITGLCYGIVLGAIRLKTKNCYSTILFHGILNIFGR